MLEFWDLEIIRRLEDLEPGPASVVTVGVFDGVHLGHQAIMRTVVLGSEELSARSVVVTFDRNPEEFVRPGVGIRYITTLSRKLDLIAAQGIDLCVVLTVDQHLMEMPADQFVSDVLSDRLGAVRVVVGTDFAFGKGRGGGPELLSEMGCMLGYDAIAVPPVMIGDIPVSSTAIRRLIADGAVERANEMLGRPFALEGQVVHGDGIGRSLGFPTANIAPSEEQVVPSRGVYAVSMMIDDRQWVGAANIGVRPTIGANTVSIEVHLIGFSGDLYGRRLEVAFHHRLRGEERFPDIDSLREQIARDVEQASKMLA